MNLSSEDPEENWAVFQNVVHSFFSCNHLANTKIFDENDEEIKSFLEEKRRLHKAHQDDTSFVSKNAAYSNICKTVQNRLLAEQESRRNSVKDVKVRDILKTIYGPKRSGATPLLRKMEAHFSMIKMLSWKGGQNTSIVCSIAHHLSMTLLSTNRLPQIENNILLDEFPTVKETKKAIQHLSYGKAPGADAIPTEVYNAGGLTMAEKTDIVA